MEENKMEQPKMQSWRDVRITSQMPLDAIVDFCNVLNQRLCSIEDLLKVKGEDGSEKSLTEIYQEDIKKQIEAQNKSEEKKED